ADTLRSWHDELNLSVIVLGTVALLLAMGGLLLSRVLRARAAADFALKANQARFHEMMYHAPIFVSVKDTEGRIKFINKALEEYFGLSRNVAAGKKLEEVVAHGIGPGALISTLDREVIKTKAPLQRELAYSTRNGTRTALFVKF